MAAGTNLPTEVQNAPDLVKQGDTPVHNHDQAEELVRVVAMRWITPDEKANMSWPEVAEDLEKMYPGLDLPDEGRGNYTGKGVYLKNWARRYLQGLLSIDGSMIQQALVEQSAEMRTALVYWELYQEAKADLERAYEFDEDGERIGIATDEDGDPIVSANERRQLRKEMKQHYEAATEEFERFGIIGGSGPNSMGEGNTFIDEINVGDAMDRSRGRR